MYRLPAGLPPPLGPSLRVGVNDQRFLGALESAARFDQPVVESVDDVTRMPAARHRQTRLGLVRPVNGGSK